MKGKTYTQRRKKPQLSQKKKNFVFKLKFKVEEENISIQKRILVLVKMQRI